MFRFDPFDLQHIINNWTVIDRPSFWLFISWLSLLSFDLIRFFHIHILICCRLTWHWPAWIGNGRRSVVRWRWFEYRPTTASNLTNRRSFCRCRTRFCRCWIQSPINQRINHKLCHYASLVSSQSTEFVIKFVTKSSWSIQLTRLKFKTMEKKTLKLDCWIELLSFRSWNLSRVSSCSWENWRDERTPKEATATTKKIWN